RGHSEMLPNRKSTMNPKPLQIRNVAGSLAPENAACSENAIDSGTGRSRQPSRREFLKIGSVLATSLVFPQIRSVRADDSTADAPRTVASNVVQLFVDDDRIASRQNVRRIFHSVDKHPANPVIRKVEPWETDRGTWGSVI